MSARRGLRPISVCQLELTDEGLEPQDELRQIPPQLRRLLGPPARLTGYPRTRPARAAYPAGVSESARTRAARAIRVMSTVSATVARRPPQ